MTTLNFKKKFQCRMIKLNNKINAKTQTLKKD